MNITLENETITCTISDHGAELKSVVKNGKEYMWQADPAYWGRTAPVLFPFVGAVAEGVYRYKGQTYPMGQHGFARDMDFEVVEKAQDKAVFRLVSNEETIKKYPLPFVLNITYRLDGSKLTVGWEVQNPGEENLYFSIGAHPAFQCCLTESKIRLSKQGTPLKQFESSILEKGLLADGKNTVALDDGELSLDEHTFDIDTFILENRQADCVELWEKEKPVVKVRFDAPLLGIWSPPHKNAPFLCLEPWYGRVDHKDFRGELSDREWGNCLTKEAYFCVNYSMEFC